jgi:hypothetical protein
VTTFLIVIGVIVGLWVLVQVLGILWVISKVLADPRYQAEQWASWKTAFVRTWQTPSTWFSLMVGALFLLLLWGSLFYMDLNWRPDHQDVVDPVRDRMVRPLGAGGQKH